MKYYGVTMLPSADRIVPAVMPMYTAEEQNSLERGKRPYTVVEILREVFKEDFYKAVQRYLEICPEGAEKAIGIKGAEEFRLVWLSEPRVESSLDQPACTTAVDLIFRSTVEAGVPAYGKKENITETVRKRYYAEFRIRYIIKLFSGSCSAPIIAPNGCFPSDVITEQKSEVTNQYLLPVIRSDDYADKAEKILKRYYTEALERPSAVDGMELAKRMKLKIRKIRFERGSDIQGRIYFDRTEVEFRDEHGIVRKEKIEPMTILVNTDLCTTPETENSTIVHECCHVYLDLMFFQLQKLSGRPFASYTSRKRTGKRYVRDNSPIDWMELQAEKLPAYILMEENNTRKVIEKLLAERGGKRTPENMLYIMQSLASFFKVSKAMAKYRMSELGYPEAEGIYAYIDKQRIPDYGCCGVWRPGITYIISKGEAAILLRESDAFRYALESGCYVYAEGHYCLNDDKYIDRRYSYEKRLTEYARRHVEECCISFRVRGRYADAEYTDGQAARKKEYKYKYQSRHEFDAEPETKERVVQNTRFTDDAVIWKQVKQNMPDDFGKAVQNIIDLKGISQNELAMRMGVCRSVQRRWCYEKTSLRHVAALCIAMDVRADIGEELIRLAGFAFQNNLEHNLIHSMLFETKDLTVSRANEIMRQNNLPPLTNGEDDELAC